MFCTTCKGRLQHLEKTLPKNLADNASCANLKFVILDYGSQDGLAEYMKTKHKAEIDSGRIAFYQYPGAGNFKMAHAKNMAHRCGLLEGADILVNVDADSYTGAEFANHIAERFNEPGIFLQAMWNRWITIDGARKWMAESPDGVLEAPIPKGSNGRMAVSARAFLKAGGYNEKFETWGPDDKDFNIRLRRLGYEPKLIDRKFLNTILHNDKVRFKEYPAARSSKGYDFAIKVDDSNERIANYGKLGMGVVYKNFDPSPTYLGTLPTRIFGIGMHKTGTTSLHHAMQILGYDSGHWNNAHWAKAIWQEMTETGSSATLEKCYALSDLPIPVMYKELDSAYPGSKFILTVRPEAEWLRSVKYHWTNANRFHHQWDNDPFSHQIHTIVYGMRRFDEAVFLERYRRHNAEVLEYFKDRSDDLLVMNINSDNNWHGLCDHLKRAVPYEPYPKAFVSPHTEVDFQI